MAAQRSHKTPNEIKVKRMQYDGSPGSAGVVEADDGGTHSDGHVHDLKGCEENWDVRR